MQRDAVLVLAAHQREGVQTTLTLRVSIAQAPVIVRRTMLLDEARPLPTQMPAIPNDWTVEL